MEHVCKYVINMTTALMQRMAVKARVLIPRLQLAPSDTDMPFVLSRCQFPLRLAYSMTINKAQGLTFSKVGIDMQRPCFSRGQLYVATVCQGLGYSLISKLK